MRRKLIYLATSIFSLAFFSTTLADDTVFEGEGETVWPIESKDIEMVAETVMVRPGEKGWDVDCVFILKNRGEPAEVQVGFPDLPKRSPGDQYGPGTIQNFECTVDGEPIEAEYKSSIQSPIDSSLKYPYAYIWKMIFKKGQTKRVTNSYCFRGMFDGRGGNTLIYVLRTGALWKGEIKRALIEFDVGELNPRFCSSIKPGGYVIKKNKIRWIFSDFEPKNNIEIRYHIQLQHWAKEVDTFINSDSIKILKNLLAEGLSYPEPYFSPDLMEYFNDMTEKLIRKVKPYEDARLWELLLAKNKGERGDVRRKCKKYLKEFIPKTEFTFEQENVLRQCTWIAGDFLNEYSLAQEFPKVRLRSVDYKINNPQIPRYMTSENYYKSLGEEKNQILRTIEFYEQKKTKR